MPDLLEASRKSRNVGNQLETGSAVSWQPKFQPLRPDPREEAWTLPLCTRVCLRIGFPQDPPPLLSYHQLWEATVTIPTAIPTLSEQMSPLPILAPTASLTSLSSLRAVKGIAVAATVGRRLALGPLQFIHASLSLDTCFDELARVICADDDTHLHAQAETGSLLSGNACEYDVRCSLLQARH